MAIDHSLWGDKFHVLLLKFVHLGGSLIQHDLRVGQLLSWDVVLTDGWTEIQKRVRTTESLTDRRMPRINFEQCSVVRLHCTRRTPASGSM